MPAPTIPLTDPEADVLFAPLAAVRLVVLAVSGGLDSTTLLHLAASWRRRRKDGPELVVATVDHGLRPESAAEAAAVARAASALGIAHDTRVWLAPKPATGLQAAARTARYALLGDFALECARARSLSPRQTAIATAHTADDQAETFLMRLARGSGIDGLAGMAPDLALGHLAASAAAEPVRLVRPLLQVPRARLAATLAASGASYADDPSNADPRFERVRIRDALRHLAGLGITAPEIARSATRLRRAQAALEAATDQLAEAAVTRELDLVLAVDLARLAAAPEEIAIRLLRRAFAETGGLAPPPGLDAVELAAARLLAGPQPPPAFTLGGCIVDAVSRAGTLLVYREPDRAAGLPTITLAPGTTALWDGRVEAAVAASFPSAVTFGPLAAEWSRLAAAHPCLAAVALPRSAVHGLPAFRSAATGEILAVPALASVARRCADAGALAAFTGPISAASRAPPSALQPSLAARARNIRR